MGTYEHLKKPIKGAQEAKDLLPIFETYKNYLKFKEPNSNYKMPIYYRDDAKKAKEWHEKETAALIEKKKS